MVSIVAYGGASESQHRGCTWTIRTVSYNFHTLSKWFIKDHVSYTFLHYQLRGFIYFIVKTPSFCTYLI